MSKHSAAKEGLVPESVTVPRHFGGADLAVAFSWIEVQRFSGTFPDHPGLSFFYFEESSLNGELRKHLWK